MLTDLTHFKAHCLLYFFIVSKMLLTRFLFRIFLISVGSRIVHILKILVMFHTSLCVLIIVLFLIMV